MKVCANCGSRWDDCECDAPEYEEKSVPVKQSATIDQMKQTHPGYRDESYAAGAFLGLDFPYVPGDPGL